MNAKAKESEMIRSIMKSVAKKFSLKNKGAGSSSTELKEDNSLEGRFFKLQAFFKSQSQKNRKFIKIFAKNNFKFNLSGLFKVDREILVNFNEPKFKCKISEKFFEEIEAKFNKDQYKKYAQWIKFQTLINNKLKT